MNRFTSNVVKAGLIVGTLDILAAFLYFFIKTHSNPLTVLKFISSGLFGKEAFDGGSEMLLAGLVLHYTIALAFTIFFFWLYPKLTIFSQHKIVTGICYAIFISIIMNLVVIPLSKIPHRSFDLNAIINVVILMLSIGIPLAYLADKFYKKEYIL